MKSIVVFFMTLCLGAPMARAQDREVQMPANEAGVSWGVMPAPLRLNVFETVFSLGKASFKNDTQAISAHYMRNLNKTFAVGSGCHCTTVMCGGLEINSKKQEGFNS